MDTASSFSQQLFEQLFRQYKRKYLLIANSYVRDSKTAEDIVHDSFMAVWEHRDNINGANIEAYLYKVIRNNCLMYRRNQQIGQAVYEQIKLKERSAMDYYTRAIESCDPDILFRNEILEICRAQLEQMPELTQQIFKARRLEGKSYKEIAEQFGIPQKKVDKQLQQAVTKLRRALKDFYLQIPNPCGFGISFYALSLRWKTRQPGRFAAYLPNKRKRFVWKNTISSSPCC